MSNRYNSPRTIISRLKRLRETSSPYGMTFMHDCPLELRKPIELALKKSFELWWDSWIGPELTELENRLPKTTTKATP